MKLRISPLVFLLGIALALLGKIQLFLSYIVAMVLHEFAHAEVSRRLGYRLTTLKIMPYGASISGEYDALIARDEIEIAVAGPICSAIIFLITVGLWWILPELYFFTESFAVANLSLTVFNLLPVYPLDGGRVLKSIISRKTQKSYRIMQVIGTITALIFVALFVTSLMTNSGNPTFLSASAFMAVSAIIPDKRCKYERLYNLSYRSEKCLSCLPIRVFMVSKNTKIKKMLSRLSGEYFTFFWVIDMNYRQIPETELDAVILSNKNLSVFEFLNMKNE